MTATTDTPTTTPEVPAWLNLDGLGLSREDLRRIPAINAEIEELIASGIEDLFRRAYEARVVLDNLDVPGDVGDELWKVFGTTRLHSLAGHIADWAMCAMGEGPNYVDTPEWFHGYNGQAVAS